MASEKLSTGIGAPTSTTRWTPEDDSQLKSAIEAGASLETLAKGAVPFSHRYTLQEVQQRWHSMLYDSDTATEASDRIRDLEGSAINTSSKVNAYGKRKTECIHTQYYSMQKKQRSDATIDGNETGKVVTVAKSNIPMASRTCIAEAVAVPSSSDSYHSTVGLMCTLNTEDLEVPCNDDVFMILKKDLDLQDQDFHYGGIVSKYRNDCSKRNIIKLEQCAQSARQRAMTRHGALAVVYGHHLKYFIKKTEVILGRSIGQQQTDLDIDLCKEGPANKVSRKQAIIRMKEDGNFVLTNLGKYPFFVNGKEVIAGKSIGLRASCLIEVRGISLVFETNPEKIYEYLDNIAEEGGCGLVPGMCS